LGVKKQGFKGGSGTPALKKKKKKREMAFRKPTMQERKEKMGERVEKRGVWRPEVL